MFEPSKIIPFLYCITKRYFKNSIKADFFDTMVYINRYLTLPDKIVIYIIIGMGSKKIKSKKPEINLRLRFTYQLKYKNNR